MPTAFLRSKVDERAALTDLVEGIYTKCNDDQRDPSTEERAKLDDYSNRIKVLDGSIAELRTAEEGNQRFLSTAGALEDAAEQAERRRTTKRDPEPEHRSAGQAFIESDAFKAYRGRGTMEPVEFEGFLEQRAAISTTTLDLPPTLWAGPPAYRTTTPLLDVLGRERVSSGSIEYITWGSSDPAAGGPIAEGELKPEATMAPTTTAISLDTYAHWKAITRQALEDYPRIRSIVEGKLRGGLANKLEAVAAAVITGATIPAVVNADLMAGIREGIGQVQAAGYQPNAILLNPADYADLDIAAAESSNSGPTQYGNYWGVPPVPAAAVPVGTVYVGNFQEGVTWFDRNITAVYMTDSHADYFVRNLLVVLAEQRSAFAVTEPAALAKVTATAAAGTRSTGK